MVASSPLRWPCKPRRHPVWRRHGADRHVPPPPVCCAGGAGLPAAQPGAQGNRLHSPDGGNHPGVFAPHAREPRAAKNAVRLWG